MIRARVNIQTGTNSYHPGEIIRESLSDADKTFLEKHNFITIETDQAYPLEKKKEKEAFFMEKELPEALEPRTESETYKEEADLKRLNKEELVAYAAGIGLKLDLDALKNDMIDSILNYIEETMEE